MWSHFCKMEKHSMYVEDGKECNWCGERQEDELIRRDKRMSVNKVDIEEELNEESIANVEVTDMPDGSARVTMDIDASAQKALIKQGLEYLIKEMRMQDKIMVMEPNEFLPNVKTWDLSDDDANALFHFGFIDAIKRGLEGAENETARNK